MTRPFILLGDKTSHGGTVISASGSSDCGGRGIARVGDQVSCPKKGHGRVTTIATGDPTALIDGRPAARHGDITACGASLIASQSLTTD
ncbi:MAG: PAAR domain-containing protein [Denitromonas halophila]|nr:MAG: PAAR domain-containing protein [Denitromonas halophila]TVT73048.1 MAG: PAAR domain-containing protein [Denitromonas halophila]